MEQESEITTQSVAEKEEEITDLKTQLEVLQSELEGLQALTGKNESLWLTKHNEIVIQCNSHTSESVVLQENLMKLNAELEAKNGLLLDAECKHVKFSEEVQKEKQQNCSIVMELVQQLKIVKSELESETSAGNDEEEEDTSENVTQNILLANETSNPDLKTQLDCLKTLVNTCKSSWQVKYNEAVEVNEKRKYENLVLQDTLEELKADLKAKDDSIESVESELEHVSGDLKEKESIINKSLDLEKQLKTMKTEMETQASSLNDWMQRHFTLMQTMTEKETIIIGLESQMEHLQTLAKNNESSWQDNHDELNQQFEQYKSENALLKESLEKMEIELRSKKDLLSIGEAECKQVSEELQLEKQSNNSVILSLEEQLETLKRELERQCSDAHDLKQRCDSLTQTTMEKETIIESLKSKWEDQVAANNGESSWQVKHDELNQQYEQYKSENALLKESLEKMENDLHSKKDLLLTVEEKCKQVSEDLKLEKQSNNSVIMSLEEQLETLKRELERQCSDAHDFKQRCDSLTQTTIEKETIIESLKSQLEVQQVVANDSESSLKVKHDELNQQYEQYKSENALLKESLEKMENDLHSKKDLLLNVEGKCKQVSEELQLEKQSNNSVIMSLEEQLETLKRELERQCSDAHDFKQRCDSLTQTTIEKETIIESLKSQLEVQQVVANDSESLWQVKHDELNQQYEQYKSENALLKESLEKMENDLHSKKDLLLNVEEKCKQVSEELQLEKQSNNSVIVSLEEQLEILKRELERQCSDAHDLKQRCDSLTQTTMEKETIIEGLKSKLEDQQDVANNSESSLKDKLDEMTHQWEQCKSETLLIKDNVKELSMALESKCGLLLDSESKCERMSKDLQDKCFEVIMALSEKQFSEDMVVDVEQQLETLKDETDAQVSRFHHLESRWIELNADYANKQNDVATTKSLLSEAHESCAQLKEELKDRRVEYFDSLQDNASLVCNLETKCEKLSRELQDKSYELILSLTEKQFYSDLVSDLKKQVQQLELANCSKSASFDALESQWAMLKQESTCQQQELFTTKSLLVEMNQKHDLLTQQLQCKETELIDLAADNKSKESELCQMQNDKQTSDTELQTRVSCIEEVNATLTQTLMENENLSASSKRAEEKCEEMQAFHGREMMEAQEKIDNYEKSLEAERKTCEEFSQELEGLKTCCLDLNAAIACHQTEMGVKEKECSHYEDQCSKFKEQLNLLTEKCSTLESELSSCKTDLKERQDLTQAQLREIEKIKAILEDKVELLEQTDNNLRLLQEDIVKRNKELEQKENEAKELEEEVLRLHAFIQERLDDRNNLIVQNLISGINMEDDSNHLREELECLREENETLKKERLEKNLNEEVVKADLAGSERQELECLREENETLKKERLEKNLNEEVVKADLAGSERQELECLREENETLKKERLEKNLNEEVVKADLAGSESDWTKAKLCDGSFSTQNFEVTEQLWSLTVEKEAVQKQLDETKIELEEIKAKFETDKYELLFSDLEQKLSQAQFDLAEMRCQMDHLESEKLSVTEDLDASRQKNKDLTVTLQTVNDENKALGERLTTLNTIETDLTNGAIQSSSDLNAIQEQIDNLQNAFAKTSSTNVCKGNARKVQTQSRNVKKLSRCDSKPKLDKTSHPRNITAEKVPREQETIVEMKSPEPKDLLEESKSMDTDQHEILSEKNSASTLQCSLLEIQTEKLNFELDRDELLQKNKELVDECQQIKDQNKDLEQKIEEFRAAAQDVGNDLRKLHDVIKDQNESLAKKRKEIVSKANEIETLRTDLAELFAKIQGKQKEVDSLTEGVSLLKHELKESKSNEGTMQDVVESLNFELAGLEEDKSSLASSLENAHEKIKELQSELHFAKQPVEESEHCRKDKIDELTSSIEKLKRDNEDLSCKLNEMRELETLLRQDAQSSQDALKMKSIECEELVLQIAESKCEIVQSTEKAKLTKERLAMSQSQLSTLELEVKVKDEAILILRGKIEQNVIDSDVKGVEISNLRRMTDDLSNKLDLKQEEWMLVCNEKGLLAQQFADQMKTFEQLKSSNESLLCQLGEKEELCGRMEKANICSESLSTQLKEKQGEVHQLLQRQKTSEKQLLEFENHITELKKKISGNDDEILKLASNLALVSDELHQSKSSKDEASVEIQKLRKDLSDKEARLKQMEEDHKTLLSQAKETAEKMERAKEQLTARLLETSHESGKELSLVVLKQWEQRCKELESGLAVERKKCQGLREQINTLKLKTPPPGDNMEDIEKLKSELLEVKEDRDAIREERHRMFKKAKEHKDRADILSCRNRVLTHMLQKKGKSKVQASTSGDTVDKKPSNSETPSPSVVEKAVHQSPSKVDSSVKLCSTSKQSQKKTDHPKLTTACPQPSPPVSSPLLETAKFSSPPPKKSPLSLRKRTSKISSTQNLPIPSGSGQDDDSVQASTKDKLESQLELQKDTSLPEGVQGTRMSTRKRSSSQSAQASTDVSSQRGLAMEEQSEPVKRVTRSALGKREATETVPSSAEAKQSKVIYEDPLMDSEGPSQARLESSLTAVRKSVTASSCDVPGPSTRSKAKEMTSKALNPITNSPIKDGQQRPKGFLRQSHKTVSSTRGAQAALEGDEEAQNCNTQ